MMVLVYTAWWVGIGSFKNYLKSLCIGIREWRNPGYSALVEVYVALLKLLSGDRKSVV